MLITHEGIKSVDPGYSKWENDWAVFYWKGFAYMPGIAAGLPSIQRFAAFAAESALPEDVLQLKGSYHMVLKSKHTHSYYSFTDSSGCFDAYFADDALSSSFLALAVLKSLPETSLNPDAVVEFLHFGHLFGNKTFFDSIRKIDSSELAVLNGRHVKLVRKKLAPIYETAEPVDFYAFFQQLAGSLRHHKVSIDLSGGIDSRLLGVLLHYYGVEFETTISGMEGISDVEIPREVADLFGVPLHVTHPYVDDLEERVEELFLLSDGLHDLFRHYRTHRHNQNRLQRGMDVAITGIGGELFKDFFWLQDFPFYSRKKANLSRLFHTRILPIPCSPHYFSIPFAPLCQTFSARMLQELSPYVLATNTETYDNIYYHYRMKAIAGNFMTAANRVLPSYAPLLDEDLVRYGYQLNRKERMFNGFHRKVITQLNPAVSKIRTAEGGISVSSERLEVAKDVQKYAINYSRRLMNLLGRKVLKKSVSQDSPEHPRLFAAVRQLRQAQASLELLKEAGILHPHLTLEQIHNQHIGSMITLATLLHYFDQKIGNEHQGDREKQREGRLSHLSHSS